MYKYQIIDELKTIPEFDDFERIEKKVEALEKNNNVIIRNNIERKEAYYYCTTCKTYHKDVLVNLKTVKKCPNCKSKLRVLSERNVVNEKVMFFMYLDKNKRNEIIARVFVCKRTFNNQTSGYNNDIFECFRYNVNYQLGIKRYTYYVMNSYEVFFSKEERYAKWRNDTTKHLYSDFDGIKYHIINTSFKSLEKGAFKYCDIKKAERKYKHNIIYFLILWVKYPKETEMMDKLSLTKLSYDVIKDTRFYFGRMGTIQKRAFEVLQENKYLLKLTRKYNFKDWEILKAFDLIENGIQEEEVIIKGVEVYIGFPAPTKKIKKLINYLYKNKRNYNYRIDYFEFIKELGFDLTDDKYLFPDDLDYHHNYAYSQLEIKDCSQLNASVVELAKMLEPYNYHDDKYTIFCARNNDDLADESAQMNHCARKYIPKIANHQTSIFFLREKENPGKSLVTLEIDPITRTLVQCCEYDNYKPNDNLLEVVYKFCDSRGFNYSGLTFVKERDDK